MTSTPPTQPQPTSVAPPPQFVRVSVPSIGVQKALRANPNDLIWSIKKQVCEKVASDLKDALNHGLFLPASGGKLGKFLDEKREWGGYQMESNCLLEFVPKRRIFNGTVDSDAMSTPKNQKRFLEDVQKGNVDKVKERGSKGMDPNFWSETGETPLSIAIVQNDKDMITALVENGAFLDFRMNESFQWKTPLHLASSSNKSIAVQTLLSYGAWPNCPDLMGLTPLYYASSLGYSECVERLLMARAETEVFDESGKGPLHQACMNNHEAVVALLVDFGANLSAVNVAGNTPLHVAAARNATECLRWLLMRGGDREKGNKSGQTALQVASLSGSNEAMEVIKGFQAEWIVPPPPKLEDLPQQPPTPLDSKKSPLPTSPSSSNLKFALPSASSNSQPSHLRSLSEQYRSSGEISATVAAATAGLAFPLPTSSAPKDGMYFPSSNYYGGSRDGGPSSQAAGAGAGGGHHFRSISEYGVASSTALPSAASRRLSHLANNNAGGGTVRARPGTVGVGSGGQRPNSDTLDPELVSETLMQGSMSMQSIAGELGMAATTVAAKKTVNRRTHVPKDGSANSAAMAAEKATKIPGPPTAPRPAKLPPPPPRVRPSSIPSSLTLDTGKKTQSTGPATASPTPLTGTLSSTSAMAVVGSPLAQTLSATVQTPPTTTAASPGAPSGAVSRSSSLSPIRLSLTQPSGITTSMLAESQIAPEDEGGSVPSTPPVHSEHSATASAANNQPPSSSSDPIHSAITDAQSLLSHIRNVVSASTKDAAAGAAPISSGAYTYGKNGDVGQDLDSLSMRLAFIEVTVAQAVARAERAEGEALRLREELRGR
ncbi:hypothetical protein HDU97_010138 [Phlyctochytrium planicorne]|nr:hypothetical protein HDU97_010138 [Phlyctochytrium planicorne]